MKEKFKISLLDNGIHSFNKGLDELTQYEKQGKKNDFQLKEAIMFLHHGIELLLKQVLIKDKGEFLIFDNINPETIKKIIKAKKEGISVFNLDKPIHTTSYFDVIQRIKAFVDSSPLDESLETRLIELNRLRNNIEHYGIDTEKSKVDTLLLKLHKPISNFFYEAGINLGSENELKWSELEKQLLLEASRLRGGGFIKKTEIINDIVNIEYVENFDEYQKLQPQSTVTKEQWESYWESGEAILKAIIDGGVRLLRKIDGINGVSIKIPFKENMYKIDVNREKVEKFLGHNFEEINLDWDKTFSNKFVYTKEGRNAFFHEFGELNRK